MNPRETFYARSDLFEANVSPRAKLVLAYLSRVSNKQGVSFPAVSTIAEKCGCCENSARKALRELVNAGFLSVAAATTITRRGRLRRTTNRYTLLFFGAKHEEAPLQPVQGGTSTDAGHSYDSKITIDVPYGHSQSVDGTDPDHDAGEDELSALLCRLRLELYDDATFVGAVRHALRRMYQAESIRVNGVTIPQSHVRSAMSLLTVDCIDFVERQLREATAQVTCGEKFLISCLYNAPLDCMAKSRCG